MSKMTRVWGSILLPATAVALILVALPINEPIASAFSESMTAASNPSTQQTTDSSSQLCQTSTTSIPASSPECASGMQHSGIQPGALHSSIALHADSDAGTDACSGTNAILIFGSGDEGDQSPLDALQVILNGAGYCTDLDVGDTLPTTATQSDLDGYSSIWHISASPMDAATLAELEAANEAGVGVYLTGERPCCEGMNNQDQQFIQSTIPSDTSLQVGGLGDVDDEFSPEGVNQSAIDGVGAGPLAQTTWLPDAPGAMNGIPDANILTSGTIAGVTVPTGAVFDSSYPGWTSGSGRIAILMDVNWLEFGAYGSYGDEPTATAVATDLAAFLGSTGSESPTPDYVALGDSFASGEGLPPYTAKSDSPSDQCHRSTTAYPVQMSTFVNLPLMDWACSGATTQHVLSSKLDNENAEISDGGLSRNTGLVTVTVGGDDAGFSHTIISCIEQDVEYEQWMLEWLDDPPFNPFGDGSCADDSGFVQGVYNTIANLEDPNTKCTSADNPICETFLAAQNAAPNATIVATDYPQIFPSDSSQQSCASLLPILTTADQSFFNNAAQILDIEENLAAVEAGVYFADVAPAFLGHGVCGSDGGWLNDPLGQFVDAYQGLNPSELGGSFHPNQEGQNAYASAIESVIDTAVSDGATLNSEGLPEDPSPDAPPGDGSGEAADPPTNYGSLSVTSLPTQYNSACEGTFEAGQEVEIQGTGFLPNASLTVTLSSPGSASDFADPLATVTSDGDGTVDTDVTIPSTATGFPVASGAAPALFFDAVGPSADPNAQSQDDNGMTALIPPSSPCAVPPTIDSVSPAVGPVAGGTSVTLSGSLFNGVNGVDFGSTPAASYSVTSPTTITAVAPSNAAGEVDISVSNASGTSSLSANDQFQFDPVPSVTSISPPISSQGSSVSVVGSGFVNGTTVRFGGIAASDVIVISATQITVTVPTGANGVDVTVASPGGVSAISSNDRFTYFFGQAVAGGDNAYGQLGNSTTSSTTSVVGVSGLSSVVEVAAGAQFSLALTKAGNVYAWGQNTYGQLGNGTTTESKVPVEVTNTAGAGNEPGCNTYLCNVVSIVAGGYSAYAVTSSGTVYAWGRNNDGQLGIGTTVQTLEPESVCAIGAMQPCSVSSNNELTGVVSVSADQYHALALSAFGSVTSWGLNTQGELGDDLTAESTLPTPVCAVGSTSACSVGGSVLSGVTAVSVGNEYSLVLTAAGSVDAWGYNADGQLGNGGTTKSLVPLGVCAVGATAPCNSAKANTLNGITEISAGYQNGNAVTSGGLLVWGDGANDALATSSTGDAKVPVPVSYPSQNMPTGQIQAVSAGYSDTYIEDSSGNTYAWGDNAYGEIGNGSTANVPYPTQLTPMNAPGVFAAGWYHVLFAGWLQPSIASISATAATVAGGPVTIVGTNLTAATGVTVGTAQAQSFVAVSPSTVTASLPPQGVGTEDIVVTTPGGSTAVGLADQFTFDAAPTVSSVSPTGPIPVGSQVSVSGSGFVAGSTVYFGPTVSPSVTVNSPSSISATTPPGAGTVDITVVTPGGRSSTSLNDSFSFGSVKLNTWGNNPSGQLGNGSLTSSNSPGVVNGFGGFTQFSAGYSYSLALSSSGSVYSWGSGNASPTELPAGEGPSCSGYLCSIVAVSAGGGVGLALTSAGSVLSWTPSTPIPAPLPAGAGPSCSGSLCNVVAISAGQVSSLALTSAGTVYAWGDNSDGELGNSSSVSSGTPVEVQGVGGVGALTGVVEVASGSYDSVALTASGNVFDWGQGNNGELGDHSIANSFTPVQVVGIGGAGELTGISSIASGSVDNYAVTSSGNVDSWGSELAGPLGNKNVTGNAITPVVVQSTSGSGSLSGVVDVSAGFLTAFAVSSAGNLDAWGANYLGQLGVGTTTTTYVYPVSVPGLLNVREITAGVDYAMAANPISGGGGDG
jgi:alpha-tubulin suppressor-like RCC1 family protein